MGLRLLHTFLMLSCGLAALTAAFLTAVLVYTVQPVQFTWRAVENASDPQTANSTPACDPIIRDKAPVAIRSVAAFATEAVLALNSYDYLDWDQSIPDALNTYFTPAAARTYYAQFQRSRLLGTITDSYYTVSAINIRPAMVIATGYEDGLRSWTVQIPVTLRYQTGVTDLGGGSTVHSQNEVFTVTVLEERPNRRNYRGVAINAIATDTVRVVDDLDRLE
jgi:hypothetical protein